MNSTAKAQAMREFSRKLRYTQPILFSDEGNLDKLENFYNEDQDHEWQEKPTGLWFSLGKSWINWLEDGDPVSWRLKRMQWITHIYRLYLTDSVLQIHTDNEFVKFEKQYASKHKEYVNWRRVAKKYDGILIRYRPKFGSVSSDSYWYWNWDVSSGCIWNRNGLRKTKLLKEWKPSWRIKC